MTYTTRKRGDNKATHQPHYLCRLCRDDRPHAGGVATIERHFRDWHDMTAPRWTEDADDTNADAVLLSLPPTAVFLPPDRGRE